MCSLTLLRMTLDCLRIGKEIGMKSGFLPKEGGRHCFILASDKNKKDQKSLQSKLLLIIIIAHKQQTLKHEINKTDQNPAIIKHKPGPFEFVQVNICFLRGPR